MSNKTYKEMNAELQFPDTAREISFHASILVGCLAQKFGLSLSKESDHEQILWIHEQISDFAIEIQQITGKFVVDEFAKKYGLKGNSEN